MTNYPQEMAVTFNLVSKGIPGNSNVYITGNQDQLGNWNPNEIPMDKIDDSTWSKTLKFNHGTYLEFKFTLGSWQIEALQNDGTIPGNHFHNVEKDTILNFDVSKWGSDHRKYESTVAGTIHYHHNMKGKGIVSRDVIVWLPPGYDVDSLQRFPVLYMHDGQNVIDVNESAFGMEWKIDETADSLIRQKKIKPIIIVGIYNTRNRNAEYSYTDSGFAYMRFIIDELKPFIDRTYRTLPGRKNTAVMGSSMGGLISLMLVWEYPEVFSKAACLSPAFKIKELNYLPYIEKYQGPKKDIKIYIDNGGVGLEEELQPGIEETIELLAKKGYKNNLNIYFDKHAEHNENAWAARVWRPLLYMFWEDE